MEKNIVLAQVGRTKRYEPVKYKKLYENNESDSSAYNLAEHDTMKNIDCTESSYSFQVILKEIRKKSTQRQVF